MNRLRVALDGSRAFGARPTGTERYATEVLRGLIEEGAHGYTLYLRAAPSTPLPATARQKVLRAPRLWTHLRLGPAVARGHYDALFVPSHVLPMWLRAPAVVTVHDLGYLAHPEAHTLFQRWYLNWSTRRHVRTARRLVVDSKATRDDLVRRYGASPERIDIVYLGVDPRFAPASAEAIANARRAAGVAAGRRYVLHVGTLQPRKNLSRLVDAFVHLARTHPDTDLVLAGRSGWGPGLTGVLTRAGLDGRVLAPGYVDESILPGLYTGAAAYILPSLYEGFGLTALEALACGTPVAASSVSSVPEVVGSAGLYFDPQNERAMAQALSKILDEPETRAELAAAGRRRAAAFTWQATAQGVRRAVERAAAGDDT